MALTGCLEKWSPYIFLPAQNGSFPLYRVDTISRRVSSPTVLVQARSAHLACRKTPPPHNDPTTKLSIPVFTQQVTCLRVLSGVFTVLSPRLSLSLSLDIDTSCKSNQFNLLWDSETHKPWIAFASRAQKKGWPCRAQS